MRTKITKLRGNYIGKQHFAYMAVPILDGITHTSEMFIELRSWCWGSFGPSCDYSEYVIASGKNNTDLNHKWAWLQGNDYRRSRILLNEDAKNWFILRWDSVVR